MALTRRQQRAYNHLCNIWRPTRSINTGTGAPGAETFSLVYSGISCHYEYTPNVDDPIEGAGRLKRFTIMTTDVVHFDAAQSVLDGDVLKNVSLLPDGTNSPAYGEFHRVLGAPRIVPSAGRRRANKRSVMAMSIEKAPAGVS